jgi:energy-converting hydrogenase Eha subunit B
MYGDTRLVVRPVAASSGSIGAIIRLLVPILLGGFVAAVAIFLPAFKCGLHRPGCHHLL